jgi:hypothetical protein
MVAATTHPYAVAATKRHQYDGTTLTLSGELLCEAVELRPGQCVLDVAAERLAVTFQEADVEALPSASTFEL